MDNTLLGRRLAHRLALREKVWLQAQFLERLARIPGCQTFLLCGGSALHGVYLQGRLSDDLDLILPPTVVSSFHALVSAHGLALERRDGVVPAYTRLGRLGIPIGIGVDIHARPDSEIIAEEHFFGAFAGRAVPVRVPPLAQMLAEKLDCVSRRARPVDFVDLWMGFGSDPALREQAFAAHRAHQPFLFYDLEAAQSHLDMVEAKWTETLTPLLLTLPAYEQVRRDILPLLSPPGGTLFCQD